MTLEDLEGNALENAVEFRDCPLLTMTSETITPNACQGSFWWGFCDLNSDGTVNGLDMCIVQDCVQNPGTCSSILFVGNYSVMAGIDSNYGITTADLHVVNTVRLGTRCN